MDCTCKDWIENKKIIDSALIMSKLRGGSEIKKSFTYCPYCACVLEEKPSPLTDSKEEGGTREQ